MATSSQSGQAATARLEIETARYNAALRTFVAGLAPRLQRDVLMSHGLEFLRRVVLRTPVRTGRLRNSIHLVPPDSGDAYQYADGQGRKFDGTLAIRTGPLEVAVGTNVVYAVVVEGGSSRQAPAGMFAVSLAEMRAPLERAATDAVRAAWDAAPW